MTQSNKFYMNGKRNYTIDPNFYSYDSNDNRYYSGLRYFTSKAVTFKRMEKDRKTKKYPKLPYGSGLSYKYILTSQKGSHEYFDIPAILTIIALRISQK